MRIALAASSLFQVVFQVGIACHNVKCFLHMFPADRCTSQIGVQDRTRAIDYFLHIRSVHLLYSISDMRYQKCNLLLCFIFLITAADERSQVIHLCADRFHHRITAVSFNHFLDCLTL